MWSLPASSSSTLSKSMLSNVPPRTQHHNRIVDQARDNNTHRWQNKYQHHIQLSKNEPGRPPGGPTDLLDRTRITSCDACRRRKIKCSRANPCHQCSGSFLDCTYSKRTQRGKRSNLRRNGIAGIDKRQEILAPRLEQPPRLVPPGETEITYNGHTGTNLEPTEDADEESSDVEIAKCSNAFHIIEQDKIEFQGYSADRSFIQGFRGKLRDWHGDTTLRRLPVNNQVASLFDIDSRAAGNVPLPVKQHALKLVEAAFDAQLLLYFIHRPTFDSTFNLIYSLESSEYTWREERFLPLLYAVFAYGGLFVTSKPHDAGYEEMISKASQYYTKSRDLVNLAHCSDLVSLQAVIFMNLFLLSTTRTTTCYTNLSASLSIAVRMGLHLSLGQDQDLISQEVGKRVFWTLRLLSNDASACIGLPKLLSDNDIDIQLPREINDVYLQSGQILRQPESEICYIAGANAYKRLHMILDKVIKLIYPHKGLMGSLNFPVKLETIRLIENDLQQWSRDIPGGFRLGDHTEEHGLQRAQYLLAITYAQIQLSLYRPLLHNFMETAEQRDIGGNGVSSFVSACTQSIKNIIALYEDMFYHGLLNSVDWTITRMLISCILTLLYVILMSQSTYEADMLFKNWATGWKLLNYIAKRSFHGRRCKTVLTIMISTLPANLKGVQERLLSLDTEVQEIVPNDMRAQRQIPGSDSYTTSLANRTFSVSSSPGPVGSGQRHPKNKGISTYNSFKASGTGVSNRSSDDIQVPGFLKSECTQTSMETTTFNAIQIPSGDDNMAVERPPTTDGGAQGVLTAGRRCQIRDGRCSDFGLADVNRSNGIQLGDEIEETCYNEETLASILETVGLFMGDLDILF